MVGRGVISMAGTVATVVLILTATLMGATEGVRRGPGDRSVRMNNLRRSNVDMKALREKYMAVYDGVPCKPLTPSPDDPPLPTVPRSFMTQVEFTMQHDHKRVIHGVEMYNARLRRGVNDYDLASGMSLSRPYVVREEIHYNQNLDEALFVLSEDPCIATGQEGCYASKNCDAGKISDLSAAMQELFGIVDTNSGEEFMGAMGLMQFGPLFNYTFAGIEQCRGARCQTFQTCINKPDEGNASLLYTYYWTADDWDVQNNGDSVPMMLDIVDVMNGGLVVHVEFFDYRRDWMPALDELEVPVDVYCQGRKTYINQPSTITRCAYKSENVAGINVKVPDREGKAENVHLRTMFPQKEWYDYQSRISRTDYIPFFLVKKQPVTRFENYTQDILEFNQNLMYRVKPRLGTCEIKPIDQNITWGDVVVGEDGSIQMMNPWNWEDLAEPMQYNGLHWERGMMADVWVGQKPSVIPKINETVVWYFASPFYENIIGENTADTRGLPTFDKVPIKLEKYLSLAEGLPHLVYHIYGFDSNIPLTHTHDVSICFNDEQMRHFTFDLPKNAIEKSHFLRENLKYAIQGALHEAGSVSPLRINRVELEQTDTAVVVTFTLLEKPSKVVDVDGDVGENTMDEAADAIRTTIDDSQLIILVKTGDKPDIFMADSHNDEEGQKEQKDKIITSMTARPHTMTEVTRSEETPNGSEVMTGYSSGDMGGLATGMILLGLLMGIGGMYLYGRKK